MFKKNDRVVYTGFTWPHRKGVAATVTYDTGDDYLTSVIFDGESAPAMAFNSSLSLLEKSWKEEAVQNLKALRDKLTEEVRQIDAVIKMLEKLNVR